MFPTVAEMLGEVCSSGRDLCRRQLGLKPRKLYLLHVVWSVRILFEQTSYVGTNMVTRGSCRTCIYNYETAWVQVCS